MRIPTLIFVLIIFVLSSCSNRLSQFSPYNKYVSDFYSQVINDSLNLYLQTPGDIAFFNDRRSVYRELRTNKLKLSHVLLYGKSQVAPYYLFFITHDVLAKTSNRAVVLKLDTIINNQHFSLFGLPLDDDTYSYKIDCREIFKSIVADSSYRKKVVTLNSVVEKYNDSNRFYQALSEIGDYPAYDLQIENYKLQILLTYASFLGANAEYYKLLKKWELNFHADSLIQQAIEEKSTKGLQATGKLILDEAQSSKLVMFNENHFYPNHRKLLLSLLPDFKRLGFNYIALETLSKDTALNFGTPLSLETGFYTREPNYSQLVRTAQGLGFKFVAYENEDSSIDREVGQAENLYKKTFKSDQSAKVLVLAGISHIFESADKQGKQWMASIFKAKYKIDPLTFNQTSLNHYHNQIDDIAIIKSTTLHSTEYNTTDWQIINNLPIINNPGNFKYKNEFDETVQIALFTERELANGKSWNDMVPYCSYLLKKGEIYSDNVPSQVYRLVVYDKNGKALKAEKVII